MMMAAGADIESAKLLLHANAIVEAGNVGSYIGWEAMEELVKLKVRKYIFSKKNLFERVIGGEINLTGVQSLTNCHANKAAHEEAFNFAPSTVGI
jgi:hypothetical protein